MKALAATGSRARLTGIPGVALVTAGAGVSNAITALKNAQLAQSPLVLIGGHPDGVGHALALFG